MMENYIYHSIMPKIALEIGICKYKNRAKDNILIHTIIVIQLHIKLSKTSHYSPKQHETHNSLLMFHRLLATLSYKSRGQFRFKLFARKLAICTTQIITDLDP